MWLKQIPDSGRTTESIDTLREKDKAINATKPALYCIAINRKVLQHPHMFDLVPGDKSEQNMKAPLSTQMTTNSSPWKSSVMALPSASTLRAISSSEISTSG
jgi:hypothetical protein